MTPAPSVGHDDLAAYVDAARHGSRRQAVLLVRALLDRGVPPEDVVVDLLAASQSLVGTGWEAARWTIAMEHRATAITEVALQEVTVQTDGHVGAPIGDADIGTVVVLSPEGEWHTLPGRMFTEILRFRGIDATALGPSLPADQLGDLFGDHPPLVAAVACSLPTSLVGAWRTLSELRRLGVGTVCGGRGFGSDGRWVVPAGGESWAPDLRAGVDQVVARLDSGTRSPSRAPTGDDVAALEVAMLRRDGPGLVELALQAVAEKWPAVWTDVAATTATRHDLAATLQTITSAVVVDDPTLVQEYVGWFERVVAARDLPLSMVSAAFDVLLGVLPLRLERSRQMASAGLEACTQPWS